MTSPRRRCTKLRQLQPMGVEGLPVDKACPDCGHRIGAHTFDYTCDICDIIMALAR